MVNEEGGPQEAYDMARKADHQREMERRILNTGPGRILETGPAMLSTGAQSGRLGNAARAEPTLTDVREMLDTATSSLGELMLRLESMGDFLTGSGRDMVKTAAPDGREAEGLINRLQSQARTIQALASRCHEEMGRIQAAVG